MGFNYMVLTGNLGRDPELRYTPNGTAMCQFSLASEDRAKINGEWQRHTTWFRVTVFGKQAEACSQFLSQGKPCEVIGRLRIEDWVERSSGKARWTAELTAMDVKFLGARDDREDAARADSEREYDQTAKDRKGNDMTDDDVPF